MQAHEIDYQIFGEEMQYVEIELDPQEIVVAEAGRFTISCHTITAASPNWLPRHGLNV